MQINKKIISVKAFLFQIICGLALVAPLTAQQTKAQINLLPKDSANIRINDTTKVTDKIVISKDAIETEINYSASDSVIIDNKQELIQLYGIGRKAVLKYESFTLSADYIEINRKTSVATAFGVPDSTGKVTGKPEFKDATQTFLSEKIKYNFKTKKGIISAARSKQNDLYILSEKAKVIPDSTNLDSTGTAKQLIYNKNAYITTCNAETPHFGFKTTKLKLIPDKMAIIGPSILELGGVPTPLVIPFGLFPMSKNKHQGILIPRNYENSPNLGIGILGLGYYIPISDQINLTIRSDIFFRGTIRVNAVSDYRKRYKYNGNIDLNFARNVNEIEGKNVPSYSYGLRIRHTQDATAHPTRTIGGSIDIQTNGFQQLNRNDFRSVTNNVLTSNFSYNQRFPGKPYSLAVSLSHSQNTRSKEMTINFPTVDFNVNTIFPFKNSNRVGTERWYDKIAMQNNARLLNTFNATDTTLFRAQTLRDAQFGIRHDASLNASFTVAKYFIVTPNISFRDYYYLKSINKTFDESKKLFRNDTIRSAADTSIYNVTKVLLSNGKIDTTVNRGFHALFDYNMGVSMQTKIFGTVQFRKGWLRGLRHVVTPSVSFNYTPDFTTKEWNYYDSLRTLDLLGVRQVQLYSRYEGAALGFPSAGGKSMSLGYSFTNNFEMKYRGKRDTADTKVKLLENIYINGSYNFAADSFQFSTISMSTNTNLFKNFTNLNINASFDPYAKDYSGNFPKRMKTLEWDANKRLLRFENLSFTLSNRATVKELRDLFRKKPDEKAPTANIQPGLNRKGGESSPQAEQPIKETSILDLFDNFSINHNYQVNITKSLRGKDTIVVGANSLQLVGEIKLTDKWSIRFGNIGYDFKNNTLTYPDLYIYRDLHCWEIGGSWQPERGTYAFFLRAKQGTFSFLSAPYNRSNQVDGFKGF